LANPDGGFLAPSAVVKRPVVIHFDKIYLKINLMPMAYGGDPKIMVSYLFWNSLFSYNFKCNKSLYGLAFEWGIEADFLLLRFCKKNLFISKATNKKKLYSCSNLLFICIFLNNRYFIFYFLPFSYY
jgi:hypothetical protein